MRWRPALAFAAVAVGAVLFSGAGPAWADGPTGGAGPGDRRVEVARPGPHFTGRVELPPHAAKRVQPARPGPRVTERVQPARPGPHAAGRVHGLPGNQLRSGAEPPSPGRAAAHAEGGPTANAKTPTPPPAPQATGGAGAVPHPGRVVVRVAVGGAATGVQEASSRRGVRRTDPVVPTGTAVVSNPSVPGTGGGDGNSRNDAGSTGMAVGTVLLVGVGLIAAGVALVGLRNRRDTVDQSHGPGQGPG